jgi:hypothetical protein
MSRCADERLGLKLHAYELGTLRAEERDEAELHILDCAYCFERASRFQDSAWLLRHDTGVRETITEAEKSITPARTRIHTKLVKYLVAAVVILAIGATASWLVLRPDDGSAVVQRLDLVSMRAAPGMALSRERGGQAEIRFHLKDAQPDHEYQVRIAARSGAVIFSDDSFSEFSESGVGLIRLPVDTFPRGFYTLTVTDATSAGVRTLVTYTFRVE